VELLPRPGHCLNRRVINWQALSADPHPALDFLDDLRRPDLVVLAATLARSLTDELVRRAQEELMIREEEARQQVIEEARARAIRCAALYQQAQEEEQ
jgi:hypothetical protein